ncbi:MAG TPA: hypothetical protein VFS39_15265 [Nitrospira sp.]|nr:hypothetical protein [Nitrospira sp.]
MPTLLTRGITVWSRGSHYVAHQPLFLILSPDSLPLRYHKGPLSWLSTVLSSAYAGCGAQLISSRFIGSSSRIVHG